MKANGTITVGVERESPSDPGKVTHSWSGGPIAWLRRDVFMILQQYDLYDQIITSFRGRGTIVQVLEWPVIVLQRFLTDDQVLICRTDTLRGKLSVPLWRSEMTYHELKRTLILILGIWRLADRPDAEMPSWIHIRPIAWVVRLLERLGLRKRKVTAKDVKIKIDATDVVSAEMERTIKALDRLKSSQGEINLVAEYDEPLVTDPVKGEMIHTRGGSIKHLTIDPPKLGDGLKAEIVEDDGAGSPTIIDEGLETHENNHERKAK